MRNSGLIVPTNEHGEALETDQLLPTGRSLQELHDTSHSEEEEVNGIPDLAVAISSDGDVAVIDKEGNLVEDVDIKKKIFDDLVAKGIITPDKEAPHCIDCLERMENIHVQVVSDIPGSAGDVWAEDDFIWIKGREQFACSPSFFGFVKEGWCKFEATCGNCGSKVIDLEIMENPHGLAFGAATRMAGAL